MSAHRGGDRGGVVLPYLLVPLLMLAGFAGMALHAAPITAAGLGRVLADPGALADTLSAAGRSVLASWLTQTLSGLAMGAIIFLMAVGLTLAFGLLGIINFGMGAFIALGAFVGLSLLAELGGWTGAAALGPKLAVVGCAAAAAMAATAAAGWAFERVLRPVQKASARQILVTVGGLIIAQEAIRVGWDADGLQVARPDALRGTVRFLGATFEQYRLLAAATGLAVFALIRLVLGGTRFGLTVRAAVENGEMVRAMGYSLGRVGVLVSVAGAALAGLGGVMWALHAQIVTAGMGGELMALLVGLARSYTALLAPDLALAADIALVVLILLWRPAGMLPVARSR